MSNKSSHTPGPYSVLEAVSGLQITAKAQTEQYQGQVVAIAEVRSWDGEPPINQVRANADLFAAAPELLAALQLLVTDVQDYEAWQRPCNALDVAKAALAKLATFDPRVGHPAKWIDYSTLKVSRTDPNSVRLASST